MTDNENVKAFEIFYEEDNDMLLTKSVAKGLLDLINRQKAEIEELRKGYEVEATDNLLLKTEISELQRENARLKGDLEFREKQLHNLAIELSEVSDNV